MKKVFIICGICLLVFLAGTYFNLTVNPPLAAHPSASANQASNHVQLVTLGNQSPLGDIKIEEVRVNSDNKPESVKIQVSTTPKGFIISDDMEGEKEKQYTFQDLDSIKIQTNTDPQKHLDKVNSSTATKNDPIYALTLGHKNTIHNVIIQYRYFGIAYENTVSID
ncbi:hypothetical protein [Salibacterium aidingense]|uniref:hypothetical protein n=1 Tax=Salibacterium aidingense TaxID=384933 RepID=UPI00047A56B0|nr:hypothetical protein [Salibacterium aidingense]